MNYQEWERSVPVTITGDSLWKMEAYRLAVFAGDLAWEDVTKLMRDRRTRGLSDQLYRSVGSVSSNVAEGYSRAAGGIERIFTVTPLALREKRAIGITRQGICWESQ